MACIFRPRAPVRKPYCERPVGMEPRYVVADCPIHRRKVAAEKNLSISLNSDRLNVAISTREAIEEAGIQAPVWIQPGDPPPRRSVYIGKSAPDQHPPVGLRRDGQNGVIRPKHPLHERAVKRTVGV